MTKPTIKDIARASNVSVSTVSRVLNNSGYASEIVKRKVHDAVKELNYQPNAVAKSLKSNRTNTIGVIIPDISNTYFMDISKGIEDKIDQHYNIIFCSSNEDPEKEHDLLNVLFEKRVDAIIIASAGDNDKQIADISTHIPVILVDRKLHDDYAQLDTVIENNFEGAYQITQKLVQFGHINIGVVNGPLQATTAYERYAGFQKAKKEFGLPENPGLVYHGEFVQKDGMNAVEEFLRNSTKPTAILSFNNTMALGVILELIKRDYNIPGDITVASYGTVESAKLLRSPGIIYISQEPYKMGVRVGEIVIGRLINKSKEASIQEIFTSKLIF